MGISDRIIVMADGRGHRRRHTRGGAARPAVVEAYLGGSIAAIERSAATAATTAHLSFPTNQEPKFLGSVQGAGSWSAAHAVDIQCLDRLELT